MGRWIARTAGFLAAALIAVACSAAPASAPATTSIGQSKKRPATWLADALAERIRRRKPAALIDVPGLGTVRLRLEADQQPVTVFAARAAGPCAIDQEYCDAALDRLAIKAIEVAEHELVPIARDRILPRVLSGAGVRRLNRLSEESLACVERPLVGDLHVVYEFPDPSQFHDRPIRKRDLARLGLDAQQLHDLAVTNLERAQPDIALVPMDGVRGVRSLPPSTEPYSAAALVRERFWLETAARVRGELVVLVVSEFWVMAASSSDPDALRFLASRSRIASAALDERPSLMVWRGGWQPYQP